MEPDNTAINHDDDEDDIEDIKILPHDSEDSLSKKSEKRSKETTAEHPKIKALKHKSSKEDSALTRPPKTETPDEFVIDDAATVSQAVEDIESMQQQQKAKEKSATTSAAAAANTSASSATTPSSSASSPTTPSSPSTSTGHKTSSSSSSSSSGHSHHHTSAALGSSNSNHHGHHAAVPPPPLHHPHAHHHYGKYVPDGYLINEHDILMTHDFIHAPTATISTSAGAASNGNHNTTDDYADMKLEEFSEAELRLTTEEMSQWQDVIKMDDYLAKGRRPQFWEEPFTRRVLDAIKNKRLEMKKAARILGVSYGTLYGRYREVYGCLKHPYSSSSMRPSQASALQHRFDIVWPAPKPGQIDIGKLRPKDLSELWTRPQI